MNPQQGLKITKFTKDQPRAEDEELILLEKSRPTPSRPRVLLPSALEDELNSIG